MLLTLDTLAEVEADEMRRWSASVSAAIAGAFTDGGADKFHQLLDEIKADSRAARGGTQVKEAKPAGRSIASKMLGIFGQMGLKIPKPRPKK